MNFEPGKYYTTRDGRKAIVYAVHEGQPFAVHGAYLNACGNWRPESWTDGGCATLTIITDDDLTGPWVEPLDLDWDCLPAWAGDNIERDGPDDWTYLCGITDEWRDIPLEYQPTNWQPGMPTEYERPAK